MHDDLVAVHVPPQEVNPAYRAALSERSQFKVVEFGTDVVGIAPGEGSGTKRKLLSLDFLCDASSDVDDPATWQPVRDRPPRLIPDDDRGTRRELLSSEIARLQQADGGMRAQLAALRLTGHLYGPSGSFASFVAEQARPLLEEFEDGSLWYLSADPVLLARAAFARSQLALALTPDVVTNRQHGARYGAFEDLTLTRSVQFPAAADPALLAFSHAYSGVAVPAVPHALVFLFGFFGDLRVPWPESVALFESPVLDDPGDPRSVALTPFHQGVTGAQSRAFLRWWVDRLNVVYSHAFDPTRWRRSDVDGFFDAVAQSAWLVTFERLLADGLLLLSQPSAPDLARVQVAFDLLDKAEGLLGYGRRRSGKGFEALLRRTTALPRINAAWAGLPAGLDSHFTRRTEQLFDTFYERVLSAATPPRRTARGMHVARRDAADLQAMSDDDYVANLCRAVRNSSHGLIEMLRTGPDRFLLATHTGGIPQELPELAAMIMFALVADAELLCAGTWVEGLG